VHLLSLNQGLEDPARLVPSHSPVVHHHRGILAIQVLIQAMLVRPILDLITLVDLLSIPAVIHIRVGLAPILVVHLTQEVPHRIILVGHLTLVVLIQEVHLILLVHLILVGLHILVVHLILELLIQVGLHTSVAHHIRVALLIQVVFLIREVQLIQVVLLIQGVHHISVVHLIQVVLLILAHLHTQAVHPIQVDHHIPVSLPIQVDLHTQVVLPTLAVHTQVYRIPALHFWVVDPQEVAALPLVQGVHPMVDIAKVPATQVLLPTEPWAMLAHLVALHLVLQVVHQEVHLDQVGQQDHMELHQQIYRSCRTQLMQWRNVV